MIRIPHISALLLLVALSSSSIVKPPGTEEKGLELLILHNNDMHARFEQTSQLSGSCTSADRDADKCYGGFPRVAHIVKEARRQALTGEGPPVLYLNAGDTYTGTAWFTIYKWKVAAEFLNALQPDAVSLGNHEFDNGVSGLTPFIRNLSCPVLAANLVLTREPDLKSEANLMNSVVFNVGDTSVGVIGYLTPDTKFLAVRNNVDYIEEVIAIKEEIERLKTLGVQIFIALGHSGFLKDLEIAKKVEDIDLVIGGHTNTFLWNGSTPDAETIQGPYPTYVKQPSGRLVPVVQAYAYTKYLGKLHILFDTKGEIIELDGNPILLNSSVPQDPDVLSIVEKYRSSINEISDEVVGSSSIVLDGGSCRLNECNLGNLIADAIVHKYVSEYKGKGWTDTAISIVQGGAIRSSIAHSNDRYNITKGDLFSVMPFDEYLVKASINGTTILQMFEHSVASYNVIRAPGQFLQMSGMRVVYDFKKKPGQRVVKVDILCSDCLIPTYMPLNKSNNYNILMNSFLSLGGDGYAIFNSLPTTIQPFSEFSATVDYIRQASPVYSAVEGRSIIRNIDYLKSGANKNMSPALMLLISIAVVKIFFL